MYKVSINKKKNRLYLTVVDIYRREAKEFSEIIEQECKKLKPGFTCITDLRGYKRLLFKVDRIIHDVQTILANKGMKKVVRVVSQKSADNELQLETISSLEIGYSAYTTTSMKIAEEILDTV